MRCAEFEAELNALLDARADIGADPRLESHAARCRACRRVLSLYNVMLEGVESLACSTVAPTCFAAVPLGQSREPHRITRRARFSLGVAAAVLVAAGCAALYWVGMEPANGPNMAKGPPASATVTPTRASHSRLGRHGRLERLSAPYMELARETGPDLAVVVLHVPAMSAVPTAFGSVEANRAPWMLQMSDDLRPWTEGVSAAWETLIQSTPAQGPDSGA